MIDFNHDSMRLSLYKENPVSHKYNIYLCITFINENITQLHYMSTDYIIFLIHKHPLDVAAVICIKNMDITPQSVLTITLGVGRKKINNSFY